MLCMEMFHFLNRVRSHQFETVLSIMIVKYKVCYVLAEVKLYGSYRVKR